MKKKEIEYHFIKKWKKEMKTTLNRMYPDIPKKDINKFLDNVIEENLKNPKCTIDNNYIHKRINTNLLEVIDWIEKTKPICAGHGVFFKNQHQVTSPLSVMIKKFLDSRALFKSQLKKIKDKRSYEYMTYDRKQLTEKVNANSIYGIFGMVISFLYNKYTAPSVTSTGQSLISTTMNAFEAFMTNNVKFNNINECITFINNILGEKYELDDSFIKDVTIVDVKNRLQEMFYDKDYDSDDILYTYLGRLTQSELNRIYYKNNIYEFSKHKKILNILHDIAYYTESFKDPNSVPDETMPYLVELWKYYNEFVFYNYPPIDRIQRLKNEKRKCVITIDTDSNMISLQPWLEFMNENIIEKDDRLKDKDEDQLKFISINLMAFIITNMIREVLAKYTKSANVPKDYRHYIAMKNEFLMTRMVLASVKKRYINSIRLREGDEIWPEKLDIKGFIISSCSFNCWKLLRA